MLVGCVLKLWGIFTIRFACQRNLLYEVLHVGNIYFVEKTVFFYPCGEKRLARKPAAELHPHLLPMPPCFLLLPCNASSVAGVFSIAILFQPEQHKA